MANRPVFIADLENDAVLQKDIKFDWVPGMATSRVQKCIRSLHDAIRDKLAQNNILEISSKSEDMDGVALSAFNVKLSVDGIKRPLECVYQSCKVFQNGGPYTDLFYAVPRDAKRDNRLRESGSLECFKFEGQNWDLKPITAFYDYLYVKALAEDDDLSQRLDTYEVFTDISFNPEKSFSCQARSAAMFVILNSMGAIDEAVSSHKTFLHYHEQIIDKQDCEDNLF